MKKELKIVVGIAAFAFIAFFIAIGIYHRNQAQPSQDSALQDRYIRPDSHFIDAPGSKTTVVEFLDPECESCAAFYPIVKDVLREYQGKIRYVVRYMAFHKSSMMAIAATEAAGEQNKYWEMHGLLFDRAMDWGHRDTPNPEVFKSFASELGLDTEKFAKDLVNPAWSTKAQRDMADGRELGVTGTPTFFINQVMLKDLSYDGLRAAINASLKAEGVD